MLLENFSDLPLEVLGEILIHCAASDSDAPTQLAATSRQFHNAVNATPGVWQRLNLSLYAYSAGACIRKINLWFSRAAACNIFLHVELKQQAAASSWPHGNPVVESPREPSELGFALRQFSSRIESLEVEAMSERDAHAFISSVYDLGHVGEEFNIGLRHLTVTINHNEPLAITPPSFSSSLEFALRLPRRIHLVTLRLVNHIHPYTSCMNYKHLRALTITRPVRSSPLGLRTILDVLRATTVLVSLEVGGRIVDAPLLLVEDKEEISGAEEDDHTAPLTLSSLTHLSLRSNLIPPLVSLLIMPELHTLRLDDLDGRRLNASVETGTMLRQLLVRMELPRETRKGTGLKVLELTSVAIQPPAPKEDNIWNWCFKRMRSLERLYVKNINVDDLMEILLPQSKASVSGHGRSEFHGDVVCPRLLSLSIVSNRYSRYIAIFERIRRSVDVEYTIVDDPLNHFYLNSSNNLLEGIPSPMLANNIGNDMKSEKMEAKIEGGI